MSLRIRIAPGITIGKTGLRVTQRFGPLRVSSGRSGTYLRASAGPLVWSRRIR